MNWVGLATAIAEGVAEAVPGSQIIQVAARLAEMEAPQIEKVVASLQTKTNVTYEVILESIETESPDWHPKDSDA